jgi:hypothetical protein
MVLADIRKVACPTSFPLRTVGLAARGQVTPEAVVFFLPLPHLENTLDSVIKNDYQSQRKGTVIQCVREILEAFMWTQTNQMTMQQCYLPFFLRVTVSNEAVYVYVYVYVYIHVYM